MRGLGWRCLLVTAAIVALVLLAHSPAGSWLVP
jgi:hypothetical protein